MEMENSDNSSLQNDVEPDNYDADYEQRNLVKLECGPNSKLRSDITKLKQNSEPDDGYKSYTSTDSLSKNFQVKCSVDESGVDPERHLSSEQSLGKASQPFLKSIDEGFSEQDALRSLELLESQTPFEALDYCPTVPPLEADLEDHFDFPTETVFEIYEQDDDGDTKLHLSIIHKMPMIAEEFISLAPHHNWLDIPNCMLQTPIHVSVIVKQHDITRRLIVGGACITLQDTKGFTPLHIACMQNDIESVELLLTPVKYDELKKNSYDIPYQKIPQNLEIKNYEGHTCLHLAALNTNLDMMKLLLDKGANINSQDGKSGRTCLHYAAETNNLTLLNFLLSRAGLNINATTYGSQTAMDLAGGHKFYNISKILHEHGGSLTVEEQDEEMDSDSELLQLHLTQDDSISPFS